jgi:glycine dehydrogenase subunit 1
VSTAEAVVQEIPTVSSVTDLEALAKAVKDDVACVLMQQPNVFGCLEPMAQSGELAHRVGALFIASVYPISLGLLSPPGAYGADIAVAEGRCLGSPPQYGGPALGLFTTTEALVRRIPGRLVGCTVDRSGRRGYTLTLQTREQHIRREKATSNICTNQGLFAMRATFYMSLLGPAGLRELAQLNLEKAHYARTRLLEVPWISPACDQPFFNEFTLQYDATVDLQAVNHRLEAQGILGGFPLGTWYPTMPTASLWCATEMISKEQVDRTVEALARMSDE